jgi:DNA invertase Pin-like site-specific DNA recombinase
MNFYIYTRVSKQQQTQGHGLSRQLESAKKIISQNDGELIKHYEDAGASAFKGDHLKAGAQLRTLYDDIQNDHIKQNSILLVEDLDRLSREELFKAQNELTSILSKDIEVWTFLNGLTKYNKANPMMLMLAVAKSQLAYDESLKKQDRIKASWIKRKDDLRNGKAIRMMNPYWIDYTDTGYKLNDKAKVIARMFELYLSVGLGTHRTAVKLTEEGWEVYGKSKHLKGKIKWNHSRVKYALSKRAVCGDFVSAKDGEIIPRVFPAIVSKEKFLKVQELMKRNPKMQSDNFINVFSTLLYCPYCNGKVQRSSSRVKNAHYFNYKCPNSIQCPSSSSTSARVFDNTVLKYLSDLDWSLLNDNEDIDNVTIHIEITNKEKEIKELQDSIRKQSSMFKLEMLDDLENELTALKQQEILSIEKGNKEQFNFKYEDIINGDNEIRLKVNQALKLLVKRFEVYSNGVLPNELATTLPNKFKEMKNLGKKQAHVMVHFYNGEIRTIGLNTGYVAGNRLGMKFSN